MNTFAAAIQLKDKTLQIRVEALGSHFWPHFLSPSLSLQFFFSIMAVHEFYTFTVMSMQILLYGVIFHVFRTCRCVTVPVFAYSSLLLFSLVFEILVAPVHSF